jgi:uncharacterized protein with HEPN domain
VLEKRSFLTVSHWQDAIIRNLEILGEASKRLSKPLKADILIFNGEISQA